MAESTMNMTQAMRVFNDIKKHSLISGSLQPQNDLLQEFFDKGVLSLNSFVTSLQGACKNMKVDKRKLNNSVNANKRQRKNETLDRPEVIPEENEDDDDGKSCKENEAMNVCNNSGGVVDINSTVNSTASGRPKRAAFEQAGNKMHLQNELASKQKLRRPSDFNMKESTLYNVYEQTALDHTAADFNSKKRPKRMHGSNGTAITSSHFFSSTLIHASSPINKLSNTSVGLPGEKLENVSIIPAPTNETVLIPQQTATSTFVVENNDTTTTRTRRTRKQAADQSSVDETIKNSSKTVNKTKNASNNTQKEVEPMETDSEEVEENSRPKRTRAKKNEDSSNSVVADKSNAETNRTRTRTVRKNTVRTPSPEPSSEEDKTEFTRTKVVKKPVNNIEKLPIVASPAKNLGENVKEKLKLFEKEPVEEPVGRVTRTKTKKVTEEKKMDGQSSDPLFKVPPAVKNVKDVKKVVKKPKEPVVDPKQAAIEEKRRVREERMQKAAAARELQEREKREQALRLEKEKEEKMKLKEQRDKKLREEAEKKKLLAQQKQAEIEQQKKGNDAARVARLKEMMEDEERKAALRKKELELQEKKIQQAKLADKLKGGCVKVIPKKDEEEVLSYSISEEIEDSDEEEERNSKKKIPGWAHSSAREGPLLEQIYVLNHLEKFFENPSDFTPDIKELFGVENIRLRQRTSSACWNRTIMDPMDVD